MSLAPILEVFVVWHPDDELGKTAADWLSDHFHSSAYAGLAGGAVEVYPRSVGWSTESGPPRPLPFMERLPADLPAAQITAVVPVLGTGLARAMRSDPEWADYVARIFSADDTSRARSGQDSTALAVGVYPLRDPRAALGSALGPLAGRAQTLAQHSDANQATLCREVAQAIAQHLVRHRRGERLATGRGDGDQDRITVFVSHTKHQTVEQAEDGPQLVGMVRQVLRDTRLGEFFDAADLQAGSDWEATLNAEAAGSALLMVRTDLYSGREWTQHEVLLAKRHDLPVVALYAVRDGEERGSFLMDHVPVVPCPANDPERAIERALNRLVDESLKRVLWQEQSVYLRADGFDWLPSHAPEPVTIVPWLRRHREGSADEPHVWILHPDPPLGPREHDVIVELCELAGFSGNVDVLTPRTFAARGGRLRR